MTATCSEHRNCRVPRGGGRSKGRGRTTSAFGAAVVLSISSLTTPLHAEGWHLHESTAVTGDLVREPMVVRLGDALFLSGYGAQNAQASSPSDRPRLWRSDDRGKTWNQVDVLRPAAGVDAASLEAARGNSDVDLHAAADGTLYFAVMGFDRETFRGTHISVGASRDGGDTWTWNRVSETDLDDRPWVRTTPDGKAHLIWNDGKGVRWAVSEDRGTTWQERDRIRAEGGSSHLAVGPKGQMAVRVSPISGSGNVQHDVDLILYRRTPDDGPWRHILPPGKRVWAQSAAQISAVPRWVEPLAFTPDGGLFHVWAQDGVLQLARRDFSGWRAVAVGTGLPSFEHASEAGAIDFYPLLTPGPEGRLAVTWFHRAAGALSARIAVAQWPYDSEAPVVEMVGEVPIAQAGGEYFPAVWLDDKGTELGVALTIQEPQRAGFQWRVYRRGEP